MKKKTGLGLVLGGLVLLGLGNLFWGNPLSRQLAQGAMETYAGDQYPDLELDIARAQYSFPGGTYRALAKSPDLDVYFYLAASPGGRLVYDGYQSSVVSRLNTYNRLAQDYDNFLLEKLEGLEKLGLVLGNLSGSYRIGDLELNKVYRVEDLPFQRELSLYIYGDEKTEDRQVYYLEELDRIFTDDQVDIISLHIRGDQGGEDLSIYRLPKELIDARLRSRLADYRELK